MGDEFQGFSGKGTADNPYLVSNILELINMKSFPDSHFKQTQDIVMDNIKAGDLPLFNYFNGVYDAGGHILSSCNEFNEYTNGLFGIIGDEGVVRHLIIDNSNLYYNNEDSFMPIKKGFLASDNMGMIEYVGVLRSSIQISSGETSINVGGLVGANNGIIRCCVSSVNIEAHGYLNANAGGIAGINSGTIEDCAMIGNTSLDSNAADILVEDYRTEYYTSRINEFRLGGITGYNMSIVKRCISHFIGHVIPNISLDTFGGICPGDSNCQDCISSYNRLGQGLKTLDFSYLYYFTYGDVIGGTDNNIYEFTGYDGYVDVSNLDAKPVSGNSWSEYWTKWQLPMHWTFDEIVAPYFSNDTSSYPSSWDFENIWTFEQDKKYFSISSWPNFPLIRLPVSDSGSNVFVKVNGVWNQGTVYVKGSNNWKKANQIIKIGGW